MRIGNDLRMGFYPTPEAVLDKLIEHFDFGDSESSSYQHRFFDPCAGDGRALLRFKMGLSTHETYAVELDSKKSMDLMIQDHTAVLHTAYENAVIKNEVFDFIFNNPPYNSEIRPSYQRVEDNRYSMEYDFLTRAHFHLCDEGIHVFIVPFDRFGNQKFFHFFQLNYIDKELVRFDDTEFDQFKQCVFIGRKAPNKYERNETDFQNDDYFAEVCSKLTFCNSDETGLKTLQDLGSKSWTVPLGIGMKNITFYSKVDFPEDYTDISTSNGMQSLLDRFQRDEAKLDQSIPRNRPKMPISNGQLGLLLASGLVNGAFGDGEDFHLAQGSENVSIHREEKVYEYETKIIETTKREAIFNIATRQGVKRLLVKGSNVSSEEGNE